MVDFLVEKGHQITVVDNLSTGNPKNKNPKTNFVNAHITNFEEMLRLTQEVDVVFHFAAQTKVEKSIKDPLGTNYTNVTGTLTLLQAARLNKVKRFIFSSSASVYGKQKNFLMKEDMEPNPLNPYALQKLIGEKYCQMYSNLFGINTVILRYFNVYGPRQITQEDGALVIGRFLGQKNRSGKMTIYGDGQQTRDYIYVSDVIRATWLVSQLEMKPKTSEVFNIGTNIETSVDTIAELIGGEKRYINNNPRGDFEIQRQRADYSKAKERLGWEPKVDIRTGIKLLLAY